MPIREVRTCRKHGITQHYKSPSSSVFRCCQCNTERVTKKRRQIKRELVKALGGKCQICGYDRCIRSMDFHHKDPGQKEFGIGSQGKTRSLSKALEEVKKCILVCRNCHGEIHAGLHPEYLLGDTGHGAAGLAVNQK